MNAEQIAIETIPDKWKNIPNHFGIAYPELKKQFPDWTITMYKDDPQHNLDICGLFFNGKDGQMLDFHYLVNVLEKHDLKIVPGILTINNSFFQQKGLTVDIAITTKQAFHKFIY